MPTNFIDWIILTINYIFVNHLGEYKNIIMFAIIFKFWYYKLMWILYAALYGVLIGFFIVLRKKATDKSNMFFVFAVSSTIGFILVSWCTVEAFTLNWQNILFICLKSVFVALSWIFQLMAFKKYFISSLQPISAIRVVLAFIASLLIFNEDAVWWRFAGVGIIFLGLISLNEYERKLIKSTNTQLITNTKNKNFSFDKYVEESNNNEKLLIKSDIVIQNKLDINRRRIVAIVYFVLSCIFNETSGILDKIILNDVTINQMQFWFMLSVSVIVWICFFGECLKNRKILITKKDWKNVTMYFMPILLIVADRFLFMSLCEPGVLVSVVSILKQLSIIVSVIFGALLYKEPKLKVKFLYLLIVLIGISIVVI